VWVEIGFAALGLALIGFAVWELIALRRDKRRADMDKNGRPRE